MRLLKAAAAFGALVLAVGARAETPAPVQPAAVTAAPARAVLLVDEIKQIRNFPVVVAETLGYLKDDRFIVTVMNIRDEVPTAQMLMDGRVDAVMAFYHHTIVNSAEGRPFKAIVTLGVTPGVKVMVANQVRDKYKSVADLKGSRIFAGGNGSAKTTVANALMIAGGHALADYTRISNHDYSVEKIAAALKNGEADLVVAPTPDGDTYEALGAASVFADLTTPEGTKTHLGVPFPQSVIYMTSARVAAQPDLAQHLATAMVRTLAWIRSHTPEQVLEAIPAAISGKDRAAYLKVLRQQIPVFATDGRMDKGGAEKEFSVLAAATPKLKAVTLEDTYTNTFADEALRRAAQR
jgi:NitT/TauT family transport system substrate-binding protein